MAGSADVVEAEARSFVRALGCCLTLEDALLMRIVAGGTGYAIPRNDGKDHIVPYLGLPHIFQGLFRRSYQKVLVEELVRHGRMAAPAEKTDISTEPDSLGRVNGRIGNR